MTQILLDTSLIIDFIRQKNKKRTPLFFFTIQRYQLSISLITHTELYAGKSIWTNKRARNELQTLLSTYTIFPLNETISQEAGKIKALYNNTDLIDAIIAATAIHHHLPLATLNRKDFEGIKGIKLFSILTHSD